MTTSRNDCFHGKAERFKLFLLTHHCYPSFSHTGNHESQLLGSWVAQQRYHHRRGNLLPDRVSALKSIDPNFFAGTARGRRIKPLSWDLFVPMKACPFQMAAIKHFKDHQGRPYVTSYNSISKYVVTRLDISDICPSSCIPESPFGSIERVLSFVLHASLNYFRREPPMRASWMCRDNPVCNSAYFSGASLYIGQDGKDIIDKATAFVPKLLILKLRGSTEKDDASKAI
jgi:hypothetical protein